MIQTIIIMIPCEQWVFCWVLNLFRQFGGQIDSHLCSVKIYVKTVQTTSSIYREKNEVGTQYKKSNGRQLVSGPLFRNKEVIAQLNPLEKCFKICYILCIRKPMYFFSFFISCYFIFSPNECPGLCRHRPGHSLGEKKNKVA